VDVQRLAARRLSDALCLQQAPITSPAVTTSTIKTHQLHHQGAVALGAEQAALSGILLAVVLWVGLAGCCFSSLVESRPLTSIWTPGVCGVDGLLQLPAC
jgi:predicted benzoate:H+ symporter BenE